MPRRKDWRIGVLGSGFIVNECHLPSYARASWKVAAIASRTAENARRAAGRHHIARAYESYAQLLDDSSIFPAITLSITLIIWFILARP